MDERVMQFRVGLMVFATLLILGILTAMFGEMPKIIHGEYKLYITFYQAPGVNEGTSVRKSGILIGRVTNVRFADDDTKVEVTVAIQDKYSLHKNEVCRILTNLLGDASLEFVRSTNEPISPELWKNGDKLNGVYSPEPTQLIANIQEKFDSTISSVQSTSSDLGAASRKLTVTLDTLNSMLEQNREGFKSAVDQANDIMTSTRNIIGDRETQDQLRSAMQQMPQMLKDTHDTVLKMRDTMAAVDRNLQNMEGFTKPLGERGERLIDNLDRGTERLDKLVNEMLKFSQALNSSEGTIGQLVNNPELYQHINRAARNIDEVSRELKPIVDDARVFSDKIARHPEMLGVKGVMQKGAGIK
ncbi:MAG: MlaD family protein [Thermoguttaceae bacterium]|jgi:phospholipid/cholesterol/gamma-HCH transport system substrate-binding protein